MTPGRTVMTVTAAAGPAVLHSVDPIYPPEALRRHVEGIVTLNVTVAADGSVAQAVPVSGPALLREAAIACVRQWQFDAKPQQAPIDIAFSLRRATLTFAPPRPIAPLAPRGATGGKVRVVAMVDPAGRVEFVQPVSGPPALIPAAIESVKQWTFRPLLRNGQPGHGTAVVDVPFGLN
jgi:TonB family protein